MTANISLPSLSNTESPIARETKTLMVDRLELAAMFMPITGRHTAVAPLVSQPTPGYMGYHRNDTVRPSGHQGNYIPRHAS